MSSSETDYLRHMLDEVRYLQEQSADLDAATFQADPTLRRAFVRSLEIIGEAAKHVSDPFRGRYPGIQWRGCVIGSSTITWVWITRSSGMWFATRFPS